MPEQQPSPAIFAALLQAQQQAKALTKDARNAFANYDYVSTEAMIAEAKIILSECGVSVLPVWSEIRKDGDDLGFLHRRYCVADKDGSAIFMDQEWAIVPGKGRPWDKAVASAATTSLNYFLRDLLQIPRVDARDDMDHPSRDEKEGTKEEAKTKVPFDRASSSSPDGPKRTKPVCPNCGTDEYVYKDKKTGDHWYCWRSKGGCGANFKDADFPLSSPGTLPLAEKALTIAERSSWNRRIEKIEEQFDKMMPDGVGSARFNAIAQRKSPNGDWRSLSTNDEFQGLYEALTKEGIQIQQEVAR